MGQILSAKPLSTLLHIATHLTVSSICYLHSLESYLGFNKTHSESEGVREDSGVAGTLDEQEGKKRRKGLKTAVKIYNCCFHGQDYAVYGCCLAASRTLCSSSDFKTNGGNNCYYTVCK